MKVRLYTLCGATQEMDIPDENVDRMIPVVIPIHGELGQQRIPFAYRQFTRRPHSEDGKDMPRYYEDFKKL